MVRTAPLGGLRRNKRRIGGGEPHREGATRGGRKTENRERGKGPWGGRYKRLAYLTLIGYLLLENYPYCVWFALVDCLFCTIKLGRFRHLVLSYPHWLSAA